MLAFIVTLRSGRRYTVRAQELRLNYDRCLELLATPAPSDLDPSPGKQVVALFDSNEVIAVVAREHLVSEEPGEAVAKPHVVSQGDSTIPF